LVWQQIPHYLEATVKADLSKLPGEREHPTVRKAGHD
jgi:hypothetical protein